MPWRDELPRLAIAIANDARLEPGPEQHQRRREVAALDGHALGDEPHAGLRPQAQASARREERDAAVVVVGGRELVRDGPPVALARRRLQQQRTAHTTRVRLLRRLL